MMYKCRKRRRTSWLQTIGTVGLGILLIAATTVSFKDKTQYQSKTTKQELCLRLDLFIRMIQTGIPENPYATKEENQLIEDINNRLRLVLETAIKGGPCG